MYSVAEAAELTGEKSSALRYWEEQFGLDIRRNPRGSRWYTGRRYPHVLCVCELKKKGLQLKEIREIIPILRTQAYAPEEQQRRERFYQILEQLMKNFVGKGSRRRDTDGWTRPSGGIRLPENRLR